MATKQKQTSKDEKRIPPVLLEGVRLIYRNFSGKAGKYNAEGNKKFSVVLTDDMAEQLERIGCKIKTTKPKEEGDIPLKYVEVKVHFNPNSNGPKITVIKNGRLGELNESSIHILDWAKIITADLMLNPYNWTVNGVKGVKLYLKSIYATLEVDPLEEKYEAYRAKQETPL